METDRNDGYDAWVAWLARSPLIGGILFGIVMVSVDGLLIAPLFPDQAWDSTVWSAGTGALAVWTGWRLRRHGGGKMWIFGIIIGYIVTGFALGIYIFGYVWYA